MFLTHFKLREQPFGVTPDPRFLMDTPSHREAWATLHYGIESGRGFVGLVAAPGLGKTTLLFRLLEELRGRTKTAFLFQTQCDSDEFLTLLLNDLEGSPESQSAVGTQEQQRSFSDWQSRCDRALAETNAEGAAILIQQGRSLVCTASVGAAPRIGSVAEIDVGLSGECFRTRRTISCENTRLDQRLSRESRQTLPFTSFLISPLCSNNRLVGVVEVFSLRKSAFGVTERAALYELGGDSSADDGRVQARSGVVSGVERAALHEALHAVLLREAEKGVPPVLIVDEAQNLNDSVLETVRLLSDFETPHSKLLQVILAGQIELRDRLASPGLVQLRQRISMMSELAPLTQKEVRDYIAHRLRIAGYCGPPLFTPEAYDFIAELSSGIPRNVNNICFQAMSLAYATGATKIGRDVLHEVKTDLSWGKDSKLVSKPSLTGATTEPHISLPYTAHARDVSDNYPIKRPEGGSPSQEIETDQPIIQQNERGVDSASKSSWLKNGLPAAVACGCVVLLAGGALIWGVENFQRRLQIHGPEVIASRAARPSRSEAIGTPDNSNKSVAYSSTALPIARKRSKPTHSPRKAEEQSSSQPDPPSNAFAVTPNTASTTAPAEQLSGNFVNAPNTPPSASEIPTGSTEGPSAPVVLVHSDPSEERTETIADKPESANTAAVEVATHASAAPPTPRVPARVDGALIKMVPPTYPPFARQARIEGNVVLSALISKEGRVREVRVLSGNSTLINAAVNAVKQWRYEASLIDGHPEDVQKEIVVKFSLNSNK